MENEEPPYLTWLLQYNQHRTGFFHSYYFAHFCENISTIYQDGDNEIALSIIIEELKKEEMGGISSDIIMELLIHLLKLVNETANDLSARNCNGILRDFLQKQLGGLKNPLTSNINFHSLKSEVKLYILYVLLQKSGRKMSQLTKFMVDSEETDNQYFVVNGCRLFIQYGKQLNDLAKEQNVPNTKYKTIERKLMEMRRWKLLAETKEEWMEVVDDVKNFGELEISCKLNAKLEETLTVIETVCQGIENIHVNPKPKSILKAKRSVTFLPEIIEADDLKKENLERTKRLRCWYDAYCNKHEICSYAHPKKDCEQFFSSNYCDRGRDCPDKHGFCGEDGYCRDKYCIYQHKKQKHARIVPRFYRNGP